RVYFSFCITNVLFSLCCYVFHPPPPIPSLFPYTTLFRSNPPSLTPVLLPSPRQSFIAPTLPNPLIVEAVFIVLSHLSHLSPYARSEEHTSELQSRFDLVCRLLLEKKKT